MNKSIYHIHIHREPPEGKMETVVLQRIMNEGGGVVIKITSVTELLAANDEI